MNLKITLSILIIALFAFYEISGFRISPLARRSRHQRGLESREEETTRVHNRKARSIRVYGKSNHNNNNNHGYGR
jgi:hypothetical protein